MWREPHLKSVRGSALTIQLLSEGGNSLHKQTGLRWGERRKIWFHRFCERTGSEAILSGLKGKAPEIINKEEVKRVQWPYQMWHSSRMFERGIFQAADSLKKKIENTLFPSDNSIHYS